MKKILYVFIFILLLIGCTSADKDVVIVEKVVTETITVPGEAKYIEMLSEKPAVVYSVSLPYSYDLSAINSLPKVDYLSSENYDEINETGFVDTKTTPLSTFSIDVDTASYSNIRRVVMQNKRLPNQDSVRIEEMLNYFKYDYKEPENDKPFSYDFEIGKAPWNEENDLLKIGIQGKKMNKKDLPSNNLVFLIDSSGSMNSANKLGLLKQSFKKLVNALDENDKVSAVVYAGSAGVILDSVNGSDKNTIIESLDSINAGGSTNGGQGIEKAYQLAEQNFIKGGNNRIILATDGDFNVGNYDTSSLVDYVSEKRGTGVYLTILGFGMGNYNDSMVERLSNAGNGNSFYIDGEEEAKKVFETDLIGNLYPIAKDVKIQIEFNPEKVSQYRLIGYDNRRLNNEDFNDDKKDAGEIGLGHQVTALYELITKKSDSKVDKLKYQNTETIPSDDIATFKLRYKELDSDNSIKEEKIIGKEAYKDNNSEDYKFASAVAELGLILRNSEYKGKSDIDRVISNAELGKGKDENGYREEFVEISKKVKDMQENGEEKNIHSVGNIRGYKVDGENMNEQEMLDIKALVDMLNKRTAGRPLELRLVGHTDSEGNENYNKKLSIERAKGLGKKMRELGLDNNIVFENFYGEGESKPVDTNETKEGRYNNRRVEIFIVN